MGLFRYNYRVETTIEANSLKEATDKFHFMELPKGVEFIEVINVENGITHDDITNEYEKLFFPEG